MSGPVTLEIGESQLVVRSAVQPGQPYAAYRQSLRHDFYYTCAYCTIAETEGAGISFEIDHYEPQNSQEGQSLVNEYSNLMYSCQVCNGRKGDICPPPEYRAKGYRFFRPDRDLFHEHFRQLDLRLEGITECGQFTERVIGLNRSTLKKVRELRERLWACDIAVAEGIRGLRKFSVDRLPETIRLKAIEMVKGAIEANVIIREELDRVLRAAAISPVLPDALESAEDKLQRAAEMTEIKKIAPVAWRQRRNPSKRRKKR